MRSLIVSISAVLLAASSASADPMARPWKLFSARNAADAWPSCGGETVRIATATPLASPSTRFEQDAQPLHAAAIEHSDGYQTRAKIHKYASFATLPLFAVELALGESLYNTPDTGTQRVIHGLLMMAADVGFLATEASAPNSGGRTGALTFETDKVTHRNIAIASMSVATAGYLIMLFGNH
jgi:hypothetical protein